MRTAGVIISMCVLIAGLATAGPAMGKAKKVDSEVEIDGFGPAAGSGLLYDSFVGDVHSRKPKCERNRLVTLYYEELGETETVGTDTTDHTGDWAVRVVSIGDDPYYAVVDRKVIKKGDKRTVCKGDTSPRAVLPF